MGMTAGTVATIGTGATAAGAASSAAGAYYGAKSTRRNAQISALASDENARLAEWEAKDALRRGERVEDSSRQKFGQLKGTQRAALASSGFEIAEGSALNILDDTDYASELEALNIRENTGREVNASQNQARQYRNQARFQRAGAAGVSPGGALTQSLITGAGQVASGWYAYNQRTGR